MHRRLLAATMTLGLLVTAVGMSGIYAVFTDRAETGDNSVSTDAEPKVADIQIAAVANAQACDLAEYSESLTTGLISASDVRPTWEGDLVYVCLRNTGASSVDLTWKVIDLVDEDIACTGDELAAGDTSCGENGAGELADHIYVHGSVVDCATGTPDGGAYMSLLAGLTASGSPGLLAAGDTMCLSFQGFYPMPSDPLTAQLAQSDRVTWRFAFDAALPPAP